MNAQKRNVTLYYEGVSCMLRADRGMISELVENLCQNAIRYNNEGGEVHAEPPSPGSYHLLKLMQDSEIPVYPPVSALWEV